MAGTGGERADLTGRPPKWSPDATQLFQRAVHEVTAASLGRGSASARLLHALSRALGCGPNDIVVTSRIRDVAAAIGRRGTSVSLERPTFQGVRDAIAATGVATHPFSWTEFPLGGNGRTTLWFTSPYRNPDGASIDRIQAESLERTAQTGLVVQNEAYRWYSDSNYVVVRSALRVGTLHKLAGGAARLAWAIGPEGSSMPELPGLRPPPEQWQAVWANFIEMGGLDMLRASATAAVRARERFDAYAGLKNADVGPFRALYFGRDMSEAAGLAWLARRGIAVNPGSAFSIEPAGCRLCFIGTTASAAEHAGRVIAAAIARGVLRSTSERDASETLLEPSRLLGDLGDPT